MSAGWQVSQFRDEERERDEEEKEERRRQHDEMMESQRAQLTALQHRIQNAQGGGDGTGGPSASSGGVGNSLLQKAQAFQQVADGGKTALGKADVATARKEPMTDRIARLIRRAKNPVDRVVYLLKNVREIRPWTMPRDYQVRMSEEVVSDIYGSGGNATDDSAAKRNTQCLHECNAYKPHFAISEILDAFVLRDAELVPELLNCEGMERLCRWRYGLDMVFEDVREAKHWRGQSKEQRTKWPLLAEYHVSEKELTTRVPSADEEVQETLKRRALFDKYLKKGTVNG
jgi:hypothetical protein